MSAVSGASVRYKRGRRSERVITGVHSALFCEPVYDNAYLCCVPLVLTLKRLLIHPINVLVAACFCPPGIACILVLACTPTPALLCVYTQRAYVSRNM